MDNLGGCGAQEQVCEKKLLLRESNKLHGVLAQKKQNIGIVQKLCLGSC